MKLERLPEYLTVVVAVVFGMLLALYIGLKTGGGNSKIGMMVIGGVIAVSVALFLRGNIWILIPLFWGMGGQLMGVSGFSVRDLMILYVFPIFLALKALKVVRSKPHYGWLDYILFFNLLCLVIAYIRNPVGTDSLGFEKIGGKPYAEIAITCLAYWVIAHVSISPKLAMKMPVLMIVGDLATAAGGLIVRHIPGAGFLGRVYSGFAPGGDDGSGPSEGGMERASYLTGAGSGILGVLYSLYSPFTTINPLYFWRFLLSTLSILFILKSGFRSVLLATGVGFVFSCYFRGGISHVLRIIAVGIPIVAIFLSVQGTLIELPPAMQRTMSFLPGKWNPDVIMDAEGSSDWRHDIWKNVWESGDKYISNWWFGDGFGMTRVQLREAENSTDAAENLTIAGNYHSLPLTAIHAVGYFGFSLFCILLFGMSFYAWKLILRAKGTPYFPLSLFFGIGAIYAPWPSLFLTGFYDQQLIGSIYSIAVMGLISRSLNQYRLEQNAAAVEQEKPFPELEMRQFLPHRVEP